MHCNLDIFSGYNSSEAKLTNTLLKDTSNTFFLKKKLQTFYLVLGYRQLVMLRSSQANSEGTQLLHMHGSILPQLPSHPGCHVTLSGVPCATGPGDRSCWLSTLNTAVSYKHSKR